MTHFGWRWFESSFQLTRDCVKKKLLVIRIFFAGFTSFVFGIEKTHSSVKMFKDTTTSCLSLFGIILAEIMDHNYCQNVSQGSFTANVFMIPINSTAAVASRKS